MRSPIAFAVLAVAATQAPQPAWPQSASPPAFTGQDPASPGEPPAPRPDNPGLFNEIGKLWDKPSTLLPSFISPDNTKIPAPAVAPDAAGTPPGPGAMPPPPNAAMPPAPSNPAPTPAPSRAAPPNPTTAAPAPAPATLAPSMVTGRATCHGGTNGAPDCKAAADALCQGKGFKQGKSLATDSAESCSAKLLIPGRQRKPEDCHINYIVTRAFCQ
ncbi:MAG TPA: hypothetical protein VGC77_08055 [Rhodopseudomonas sp.]|uniref:hypothetical protein n=1 Tax=Rhodopseudomonas sp. TaxID=1078 RepID=UPI002ED916BB